MIINQSNINHLLRGASLLACGGGLPFVQQQKMCRQATLSQALRQGIVLLDPEELADNDLCVTVSEVGAASAPVMDKSNLVQALQLFEAKTGQKVTALIPGEIGQESIVIEAAARLQLPIVDSDLSGCRAVPRLSDLALVRLGVPFTMSPLVVMGSANTLTFVAQQASLSADEDLVRALVPPGQIVTLLGAGISGQAIKQRLNYRSYSLAMLIGKKGLTALKNPVLLDHHGQIAGINIQQSDGFDKKIITIVAFAKKIVIEVENEYMKLVVGGVGFEFPQLIMLVEPQSGRGLHSSETKVNQKVRVMVLDAFDFWKGKND